MLYNVLLTRPLDKVFTYSSSIKNLKIGQTVIVSFGKKNEVGIIWAKDISNSQYEIKGISKVIDNIILSSATIKFIIWVADYTLSPLGSVLKLSLIHI